MTKMWLNVTFVTLTIDSSKVHVYSMNLCNWYIYLEFDGINYQKHDFYLAQFAYPGLIMSYYGLKYKQI